MDTSLAEDVQALSERLDEIADPAARECAEELAAAIVALYGDALERIIAMGGSDLLERLAADEDLSGLLLAHGLHPLDLESRVAQVLEKLRPELRAHGAQVELLSVYDAVLRSRSSLQTVETLS